jgi:hypothetical protein
MERKDYIAGVMAELEHDFNALLALPRLTEDEWEQRFQWLSLDNAPDVLEDTPAYRKLLAARDPRLVWSQIDDPSGEGSECWVVPGYWKHAHGWYLTGLPWDPAALCVCVLGRDED